MKNILCFYMKDISFERCGELFIWIATGILIIVGILEFIKKPKK